MCSTASLAVLVNRNVQRPTASRGEAVFAARDIRGGHQLFDAVQADPLAALKFIDRRNGFGVRTLHIEGNGLVPRDPHQQHAGGIGRQAYVSKDLILTDSFSSLADMSDCTEGNLVQSPIRVRDNDHRQPQ